MRPLTPQQRLELLQSCLSLVADFLEDRRSELIQAIQQLDCPADRFDLADFAQSLSSTLPSVIRGLSDFRLETLVLTAVLRGPQNVESNSHLLDSPDEPLDDRSGHADSRRPDKSLEE